MSACEKCWAEASARTMHRGGDQFDNYIAVLHEHDGDDTHYSQIKGCAAVSRSISKSNKAVREIKRMMGEEKVIARLREDRTFHDGRPADGSTTDLKVARERYGK